VIVGVAVAMYKQNAATNTAPPVISMHHVADREKEDFTLCYRSSLKHGNNTSAALWGAALDWTQCST
jgi:hypothetical protein